MSELDLKILQKHTKSKLTTTTELDEWNLGRKEIGRYFSPIGVWTSMTIKSYIQSNIILVNRYFG